MSAVTGTWSELIYANNSNATALASFTTEASAVAGIANLGTTASFINGGLPGGFYSLRPGGGVGTVVKTQLRGVFSSAAGTATFTFGLRFVSAAGALIATTTALTPATLTNAVWHAEINFILTTAGPGTTAQGRATGFIVLENSALATGTTLTSAFCGGSAFGTPTPVTPTLLTGFDSTIALPIVPTVACSASSATNAVTVTEFMVWGFN